MKSAWPKSSGYSSSMAGLPRSLAYITASVAGLAIFLVLASSLLVSYPISSAVQGYFYKVDSSSLSSSQAVEQLLNRTDSFGNFDASSTGRSSAFVANSSRVDIKNPASVDNGVESKVDSKSKSEGDDSNMVAQEVKAGSDDSGCDLFNGTWFYDPLGPLYTNNTCPVITQMQNCQGNGRPDHEYENWRWKPSRCELPRFDAKKFLELMRGKTIAFIGDSVARNQMESLLCLLWQVEAPKNRGNKRMQRHYFKSTDTTVIRMWSSWLVHQTSQAIGYAPEGVTKVHLDEPDYNFMEFVPNFDVVVLSSGHWFAKQSVYVLNKSEIAGGQLWWPDKSREMKVNNIQAFEISVETIVASMLTHPNYTGLTILRSYSPDHYEGGAWNTGGSCTGKTRPLEPGHLVKNEFTNIMHEKQMTGFEKGLKKAVETKKNKKSKFVVMDITEVFGYRHDGHPGPYRSLDPNKRTQFGPDGRPPPQDCLHWCMPGPIDTWNELVLEIVRREFEKKSSSSS